MTGYDVEDQLFQISLVAHGRKAVPARLEMVEIHIAHRFSVCFLGDADLLMTAEYNPFQEHRHEKDQLLHVCIGLYGHPKRRDDTLPHTDRQYGVSLGNPQRRYFLSISLDLDVGVFWYIDVLLNSVNTLLDRSQYEQEERDRGGREWV